MVVGGAFVSLVTAGGCGFPEYAFRSQGGSGASITAGNAPTAGSSPQAGAGGSAGGLAAGGMSSGGGGEAGAAGAADDPCVWPAPVVYPGHCFDKVQADGESGIDCGGGECAACSGTQTCGSADDCASGQCTSGQCVPVFGVQYTSIVTDELTRAPKFRLVLSYLDSTSTPLSGLTIRYYFSHNGVSEPVLGLSSQAIFIPPTTQADIHDAVRTQVHRSLPGPAAPNNQRSADSYLEISFDSPLTLLNGVKLDITQDFATGADDSKFQQSTHYSFVNGTSIANEAITIYRGGKRVWGIEPPWVEFPACAFAAGVNVNGDALVV